MESLNSGNKDCGYDLKKEASRQFPKLAARRKLGSTQRPVENGSILSSFEDIKIERIPQKRSLESTNRTRSMKKTNNNNLITAKLMVDNEAFNSKGWDKVEDTRQSRRQVRESLMIVEKNNNQSGGVVPNLLRKRKINTEFASSKAIGNNRVGNLKQFSTAMIPSKMKRYSDATVECSRDIIQSEIQSDSETPIISTIALNIKRTLDDSNIDYKDLRNKMSGNVQNEFETVWIGGPDFDDNEEGQNEKRRTRKRIANKAEWPREIAKSRRQHGQAYIGYEKKESKKIVQDKPRRERVMGPRCSSTYCLKSVKRNCNDVPEVQREDLCYKFWNDMTWDQKKIFIVSLVDVFDTNRKYVKNSRRSSTFKFFLKINKERKQVCKFFFLSTFDLSQWMVMNWVKQSNQGIIPSKLLLNARRSISRPHSQLTIFNQQRKQFLIQFFDKLPKMESHYCRKQTEKKYLQPDFQSLAQLYDFHVYYCKENGVKHVSKCYFCNLFHSSKLGLYKPKKDRCDTCVSFEAGNGDKQEYDDHIKQKDRAQEEKKKDKKRAVAGEVRTLLMDVEAVKLLPVNNCNSSYFKTKLKMHNFTIYDLATTHCVNYWWHEGEGEVTSSMFVTCIIKYIKKYCNDTLPLILWSDGCTYQNRNQILANALLDYAISNKKEVTQKFLVKGHTQMEVDNVHALIERKLKNRPMNLPSDYIDKTKIARRSKPLEAELLTHKDFQNFDDSNLFRYTGVRPGKYAGDPTVYDLRTLNYRPDGQIEYKINFDDNLKILPGKPKNPIYSYLQINSLYSEPLKIKQRKYDDLQDLKRMLPFYAQSFYDNLNH